MTGLQTNIGLISGINYVELVDQLIRIDGRSRDILAERTERLEMEKNALVDMMALFLKSTFMIRNLNNMTPFLRTDLTSSNPALMTASRGLGGMPVPGSFTFTPLQMASAQQTVASGVASATEALGKTGTITIGKGWSVENEVELRHINGGDGFDRGRIRLFDGNGASAVIDLRNAMTVNDVVKAINENYNVDVIAEIQDDRLVLRDVSGAATRNVVVQEVSGGTTAASLGLIGSGVTNTNGVLTGNSIWRLSENTQLSMLNDGMGLVFNNMGPDLLIVCRDNTLVTVDFNRITTQAERDAGAPDVIRELTVGDLLNTINTAGNGKVTARISDDGRGIVIDDHTTGQHLTQISQPTNFDSPILRSLGLTRGNETSVDMFTGLTDANTTAKMYVENTRTGEKTLIELSHEEVGLIRLAASQTPASTPFRAIRDTVNTKLEAAGLDLRLQANSTNTGYDFVGSQDFRFVNHEACDLATRLGLTAVAEPGTLVVFDGVVPGKIEFVDKAGNEAIIDIKKADLDNLKSIDEVAALFNSKIEEFNNANPGNEVNIKVNVNAAGDRLVFVDDSAATGTMSIKRIDPVSIIEKADYSVQIAIDPDADPGKIRFTDRNGNSVVVKLDAADLASADLDDRINAQIAAFNAQFDPNDPADAAKIVRVSVENVDRTDGLLGLNITSSPGATGTGLLRAERVEPTALIGNVKTEYHLEFELVDSLFNFDLPNGTVSFVADGTPIEFNITAADADELRALFNGVIAGWLTGKLNDAGATTATIQVNDSGSFVLVDTNGASGLSFADVTGLSDIVDPTSVKVVNQLEVAIKLDADPGKIRFFDGNGVERVVEITQTILDELAGLGDDAARMTRLAEFLEQEIGNTVARIEANGDKGIIIFDETGGGNALKIEQIPPANPNLIRVAETQQRIEMVVNPDAEPGSIRLTGANGRQTTIVLSDEMLAAAANDDMDGLAQLITAHITMFNHVFAALNDPLNLKVEATNGGLLFFDSVGGTTPIRVEQIITPPNNTITGRLNIEGDCGGTGEIESIVFSSVRQSGGPLQSGTFQTRSLLGGLDTVLVSSLNAGMGMHAARPGVVEVQDRTGKKAMLEFSHSDLQSMQTLGDAVRIYNAKLSEAGVGLTVRINDNKTGLTVVDTTGSSSHNLIFRDFTDPTTIPAVPAIDAVSAPVSGANAGTAILTFAGTAVMNGATFGFTLNESEAGYDDATQKFTFYLAKYIVDAHATQHDQLVKANIDEQLERFWGNRAGTPPEVMLTTGMGARAIADATSGGETRIATGNGGTLGRAYVPEHVVHGAASANIASSFGLNVNAASSRANGTVLDRQVVSHNTLLSELNGGAGVNMNNASITITGSQPNTNAGLVDGNGNPRPPTNQWTIRIDQEQIRTVGDLIDIINRQTGANIVASINTTGDGIMITDRANGPGTFSIRDTDSNSKFAETMRLTGSLTATQRAAQGAVDGRGEPVGRLSMSETHRIEVEATDSLEDIRKKINDLNTNYSASIIMDGTSAPFRLSISAKTTGAAGAFNIDLSALGLTTETLTKAQDAMIAFGDTSVSTGLIMRSSTNTFRNTINGIDLTITGVSNTPVTITSTPSNMEVRVSLQQFVETYNEFREFLNQQTYFIANDRGIRGEILWNCQVSRALDRDITRMLQETVTGIPGIRSLADLGITMNRSGDGTQNLDTGKLSFDEDRFNAAWERDPDAVRKFFFDERVTGHDKDGKEIKVKIGWAQRFSTVVDGLTGSAEATGKLPARIDALTMTIDRNDERLTFMEQRLEFKRQMYLKQFYAMEQAMARMTSDMASVGNIMNAWQSSWNMGG